MMIIIIASRDEWRRDDVTVCRRRVAPADAMMTTTSVMSARAVVSVTRGRHRGRDAMMTTNTKMTMPTTRPGARARRATVTLARTGDEERDDDDDSRTLSSSSSLLDALEDACPVPRDQRPASQYEELRDGALTSWPG